MENEGKKTLGNFAAYVICINYVVGTGIFRYYYNIQLFDFEN